jgi:Na+/H+-dicarboxylate symporter
VADIGTKLKPLGDIFIRLIQMVVGLIIFCTVTHGIASVRDLGKVGRIALKAMVYFELVTSLALVIGLVAINVLKPGVGMHVDPAALNHGIDAGSQGAPRRMILASSSPIWCRPQHRCVQQRRHPADPGVFGIVCLRLGQSW